MSTNTILQRLETLERRIEENERRQAETAAFLVAGATLLGRRIEENERQQAETETLLVAGAAVLVMGARAFASDCGWTSEDETFDQILELLAARLSEPSARVHGYDEVLDLIRAHLPFHRGLRLVTNEESADA